MSYILEILSEEDAKDICNWKYEGEYSVYNFSDWETVVKRGWDLSIKESRESEFIAVMLDNQLIAYGRISMLNRRVMIGIGLKPSHCGQGHGKFIMNLLIAEASKRFPGLAIALQVRNFNQRAIKCYKKVGFDIKDKYVINSFNGIEDEFYYMEYMG